MRFLRRLAGNGGHPLPLPLGEVAERSEDGEGKCGCNALSVTCGDSSPRGRAKGLYHETRNGAHLCRYAPQKILGSTAQFGKKSQAGFLFQFKVPKMEEYCMYFPFSELRKWSKKTAETRGRNCAVLPLLFSVILRPAAQTAAEYTATSAESPCCQCCSAG